MRIWGCRPFRANVVIGPYAMVSIEVWGGDGEGRDICPRVSEAADKKRTPREGCPYGFG